LFGCFGQMEFALMLAYKFLYLIVMRKWSELYKSGFNESENAGKIISSKVHRHHAFWRGTCLSRASVLNISLSS